MVWKTELDLGTSWLSGDARVICADILKKLPAIDLTFLAENNYLTSERTYLVDEFTILIGQESIDEDEFDQLMNELYDWADQEITSRVKLCWVRRRSRKHV